MQTIDNNNPQGELPSSRTLLRSTLIAAAVAVVLLITVVLPAEYGVDPTGIGRVLGLKQMGEIKMSLAQEAAEAEAAEAALLEAGSGEDGAADADAPVASTGTSAAAGKAPDSAAETSRSDVTTLTLAPNEGKEVKLEMQEGARVNYQWTVEGGVVNYDTHGDRPGTSYHGYGKGLGVPGDKGVLVAAFDGMHGWFWRNRTGGNVTVTLRTEGDYQAVREMY
jgi:hypothetical protein